MERYVHKSRARKPAISFFNKPGRGVPKDYDMNMIEMTPSQVDKHARMLFLNWVLSLPDIQFSVIHAQKSSQDILRTQVKLLSGEPELVVVAFMKLIKQISTTSLLHMGEGSHARGAKRLGRRRQRNTPALTVHLH